MFEKIVLTQVQFYYPSKDLRRSWLFKFFSLRKYWIDLRSNL